MELGDDGRKEEVGRRAMRRGGDGDDDRQHPCDGDDEGTRQPYKCAFCRRGFPTAQALGGHMNVHRKDRPATKAEPRGAGVCSQESPAVIDALLAYGVLVHPEASGAAGGSSRIRAQRPPRELRLFGHVNDAGRGKEDKDGREARDRGGCYDARDGDDHGGQEEGEEEVEELDLELRLGAAGQ
ncbi:hypothetical protein ZWY2020_023664 [Hordeum vulgare]|uniref:C2H2-type domain-containing protein n=1 Tax=Hordeum vulgare subsp. vulgare TaxID=112509 RepID=A0A8I6Y950_HORVV|nr:hypothetical protein ZWY2020_023664 [Hordeum vulgare]